MSTSENASPSAPRRDRLRASERVVRLSATAALDRAVVRLQARAAALEERLEASDENAWAPYCEAIEALATLADRITPGRHGELLTTRELASKLGLSPKTVLRRKARGELRPALQTGKLIRWRGDEVPR